MSRHDPQRIDNSVDSCVQRYANLVHLLRFSMDVRTELYKEFPTFRYLSQMLAEGTGPLHCPHELKSLRSYEEAATIYLSLGPGIIENNLLVNALRDVIADHWQLSRQSTAQVVTINAQGSAIAIESAHYGVAAKG